MAEGKRYSYDEKAFSYLPLTLRQARRAIGALFGGGARLRPQPRARAPAPRRPQRDHLDRVFH